MDGIVESVIDCAKLILKIIVIGYKSQGESIVFELSDSDSSRIMYLGCIDSYELNKENKTIDYINSLNGRKLDFLCWSHPDNDHSKGLVELYEQCCSADTLLCMPATLDEKLNKKLDLSDSHRKIYDLFDSHNQKNPGQLIGISVGLYDLLREKTIRDIQNNEVKFQLYAIAPNGGLIRDWRTNKSEKVKNILSVGLMVKIGEYRFILGGDMPDDSIFHLYRPLLEDPLWIKIPHHGSDTSMTMTDMITYESRNLYASVTAFPSKGLPHSRVINHYMSKGCSRVDSTHTGDNQYGIIEYSFDLFNHQTVRIRHTGNACKIR